MSPNPGKLFVFIVGAALLGAVAARAEEEAAMGMKLGPGSRLLLSLDTSAYFTDNAYYSENSEESAIGLIVKPAAEVALDRGNARYSLLVGAEAGAFDLTGDADDYVDTSVRGGFEWTPLTRHKFKGQLYHWQEHDPFGTQRTEGTPTATRDLDEWRQVGGSVVYRFGAPSATINAEGEIGTMDRRYTTNRDLGTRFLDHDIDSVRGTIFYNVSSKTALLAEVISSDVNYDEVAPGTLSRSGDVMRYRVGATWLATAKTRGDVRIGKVEREFDEELQPSYDELDWQIAVSWMPRARDVLSFTAGRDPVESYINTSSVIDNRYYNIAWAHDWGPRLQSKAGYTWGDSDFRGIGREDEFQTVSLGLEYKPFRKWALFANLAHAERDSNFAGRSFDATTFLTGIKLDY